MNLIDRKKQTFSKEGVIRAPNEEGIYLIVNYNLDPIYIGRGNLRKRLTGHYLREHLVDKCIWSNNPTHFYLEICSNSKEREKELLKMIPTSCNEKTG